MTNTRIPSGSGARGSRPGPFHHTPRFREPDWEIYEHAISLPLKCAVALSCNIWAEWHPNPDAYNLGSNWCTHGTYNKRLKIALLRIGEIVTPRFGSFSINQEDKEISLANFRTFGESIGWDFPDRFPNKKTSDDSQHLMMLAIVYPDKIKVANWEVIRNIPCFKLIESVALSVDLDPVFADIGFAVAKADEAGVDGDIRDLLLRFVKRCVIAQGNIEPFGTIPVVQRADTPYGCIIRLVDFAAWADGQGWPLPAEFPRSAPSIPPAPAPAQESAFVAWANAEREKHGRWPPTRTAKGGQIGCREWAAEQGIARVSVEGWAKDYGFVNERGAPEKCDKQSGQ